MRTLKITGVTFCLFLLTSFFSFAQNYRPFYGPENQTFRYLIDETASSVNEFFHIRIDSLGTGECYFPRVARATGLNSFLLEQEHELGSKMIARPDGSYEFHSPESGDTIFLQTQVSTNTPWIFRSDSSITAQIVLRQQLNLFGSTPDSVLLITLSDGNEIHLSQNHGMLYFPRFSSYFRGDSMLHYSIIGEASLPTIRDYYGWDPGDNWGTYEWRDDGIDYYSHTEVLSATVSPDGNQLVFELDRRTVSIWPGVQITDVRDTISFMVSDSTHPWLLLGSMEFLETDPGGGRLVAQISVDSNFNGLPTLREGYLVVSGNQAAYLTNYNEQYALFPAGLGKTFHYYVGLTSTSYSLYRMECYSIGNYQKLPCRNLDSLIMTAVKPAQELTGWTVFPNPSQGDLTLERTRGTEAMLFIHDLSGRLVWQDRMGGGVTRQEIRTGLQPGIYVLRVVEEEGALRCEKLILR